MPAAAGLSHPAEAPVRGFAAAPLRVVVPATPLLLLDFAFTVQPVRNNRIIRYVVTRLTRALRAFGPMLDNLRTLLLCCRWVAIYNIAMLALARARV